MTKPVALSDLLRDTLIAMPGASAAEIREACRLKCALDPALREALFDYWFDNSRRDFEVVRAPHCVAVLPAARPARVAPTMETRAAAREHVEAIKARVVERLLLDHALSDGTLLRHATFGACAREAGWLAAVAKQGKPQEIVGRKLTEDNLQNLMRRFQNAPRGSGPQAARSAVGPA